MTGRQGMFNRMYAAFVAGRAMAKDQMFGKCAKKRRGWVLDNHKSTHSLPSSREKTHHDKHGKYTALWKRGV